MKIRGISLPLSFFLLFSHVTRNQAGVYLGRVDENARDSRGRTFTSREVKEIEAVVKHYVCVCFLLRFFFYGS